MSGRQTRSSTGSLKAVVNYYGDVDADVENDSGTNQQKKTQKKRSRRQDVLPLTPESVIKPAGAIPAQQQSGLSVPVTTAAGIPATPSTSRSASSGEAIGGARSPLAKKRRQRVVPDSEDDTVTIRGSDDGTALSGSDYASDDSDADADAEDEEELLVLDEDEADDPAADAHESEDADEHTNATKTRRTRQRLRKYFERDDKGRVVFKSIDVGSSKLTPRLLLGTDPTAVQRDLDNTRYVIETRKAQAQEIVDSKGLRQVDAENLPMNWGWINFVLKADVEQLLDEYCEITPEEVRAALGCGVLTPERLAELPGVSDKQVCDQVVYLDIGVQLKTLLGLEEEKDLQPLDAMNIMQWWLYGGSATGDNGFEQRAVHYEKAAAGDPVSIKYCYRHGEVLSMEGVRSHLRPIHHLPREVYSPGRGLFWEGILVDKLGLLNPIPGKRAWRSQGTVLGAEEAFPPAMSGQTYQVLNDAHPFKQRWPTEKKSCSFKEHNICAGADSAYATRHGELSTLANRDVYCCRPCSQRYRSWMEICLCGTSHAWRIYATLDQEKHKRQKRAVTATHFDDFVAYFTGPSVAHQARIDLVAAQNGDCLCGRNLSASVHIMKRNDPNYVIAVRNAHEPFAACIPCWARWKTWSDKSPAGLAAFQTWQRTIATSLCVCGTDAKPVQAKVDVSGFQHLGLRLICIPCRTSLFNLMNGFEAIRPVGPQIRRFFLAARASQEWLLKNFPGAPRCGCKDSNGTVPALIGPTELRGLVNLDGRHFCGVCRYDWCQRRWKHFKDPERADWASLSQSWFGQRSFK